MKWKTLLTASFMSLVAVFFVNPVNALEPIEVVQLLASDGASNDYFGASVAVDGSTAVIGAYGDDDLDSKSGSAYVYMWDGVNWVEQPKLTASDGTEGDLFGWSVAVDGGTIVIGAKYDTHLVGYHSGSAYVFMWNGTTWTEHKLTASDAAIRDNFGVSVAVDGNTVIIGADGDSDLGYSSGSAYVFMWDGTGWVEQTKLTASDGYETNRFGYTVAVDGDTAVIGSNSTHSAYIFTWDGVTWVEQSILTTSDGATGTFFGRSVSVDGNTVIIGAPEDYELGPYSGSAHVFMWDGTSWVGHKLRASDGAAYDYFGESVSVSGNTAVIGAKRDDDLDDSSGSAYVFLWDGVNWVEQPKLTASDGAEGDQFGRSVAVDGNTVIIGASDYENELGYWAGSTYIFSLLSNETPPGEDVVVKPPLEDENGDPIENALDISFLFEEILEGGDTTVVVTEPGSETTSVPSGFRITGLTNAPVLFDIETTATLAPDSTFAICFDYSEMDVTGNAENLSLAHEVDGEWVDITSTNDTINMVICGVADSFSYFAIFETLKVFGPIDPISVDTEAILGIDVGDPSLTDTVQWQWGDGFVTDVTVATNEVLTGHTYAEAGVYTVTAILWVDGIEAGSVDFQYVVVYDPSAGFVTGGGWFYSQEGAYVADPTLTGHATFGFISKYFRRAIIPSGNTEFQFKAGDLDFRSSEYQWLVIAGSRAQFKGIGAINEVGNFGFMLTVVDEALTPSTDADLFRIKIWDMDEANAVIYDNHLGADDDSVPTTAIEDGSIIVHKVSGRY